MFRLSTRVDPDFLTEMLYEAAFWRDSGDEERPSLESLLAKPEYSRYVEGWGREGDVAVVAMDRDDQPVGAAWYRRFDASAPGFGFFAEDIPELSIAVYPECRRRGVGRLLLGGLLARASASGERAVSLSVEPDNPARHLYERLGFEVVIDGGGSLTMVATLVGTATAHP